jgi:hypothetical protein
MNAPKHRTWLWITIIIVVVAALCIAGAWVAGYLHRVFHLEMFK